jgi:hypothetical protein
MPPLHHSASPGRGRSLSRLCISAAAIGLSVLAPGCSPEGDTSANVQNEAAALPAAAEAARPTASFNATVGRQIADKRRALIADAVSALDESYAALDLLTAGNADKAVKALSRATGKLDIVLAADPDLALAPVDVRVTIHDVIATPADVEALRDRAEEALEDGRLQDARHRIAGLASEHIISTVNIPLASYPAAIKQAAARILSGSTVEGRTILETALAALVVEDLIVPLPRGCAWSGAAARREGGAQCRGECPFATAPRRRAAADRSRQGARLCDEAGFGCAVGRARRHKG